MFSGFWQRIRLGIGTHQMVSKHRYFVVFKPYGMLSQFTPEGGHPCLKDLLFSFPNRAYPVGRLDSDSEGLLLITDDTSLNQTLLNPEKHVHKTYWAQVEGIPSPEALGDLQASFQASIPQLQQSAGEGVAQEFANNVYNQGQKIKTQLLADLNAELPEVERILNEKIGAILGRELPEMEENMRQKLNDEIRALLQSVKFVLPN